MTTANSGKITAATGMITEDYLANHLMKSKGEALRTTSDNKLLPTNKDACFGDYPRGSRYRKPKLFVPKPNEEKALERTDPAWEKSTVVAMNSKFEMTLILIV